MAPLLLIYRCRQGCGLTVAAGLAFRNESNEQAFGLREATGFRYNIQAMIFQPAS
jgi:hypothetical protein